ncbi:GNAT family N-acetyltransferase [Actinomadura verrucosospora]|uniref:GCN5-like N-acetyltransferase n=1 Tax=Actinomadura verrucosospora TaxID=46165 RepID=A0A7D3VRX5_ACTVE|nr:GNAT family N-acetyltransferase [Actinomadura verrucosospora]QKG20899.1 GCN5-like N-acetyltransferase [Actinomadura verrucosospora]
MNPLYLQTGTAWPPDGTAGRPAPAEIRPYTESDRTELLALFGRARADSPSASLWGHEESEAAIYLTPYMDLEPESLFVAESGGRLVGCLTGCRDSARLPSEEARTLEAIRTHRLMLRPRLAAFFARSTGDLLWAAARGRPRAAAFEDPRWPAHLHINLVPEARGTGAAENLMTAWFERLRSIGSPGCHLQTLCENTRALSFFRRMGFTEHGPARLVPGLRYRGRRLHQRTMIWTP